MNNRFELSPKFTVKRERAPWNIETVMAKVHNLSPERVAFIATILAGARPRLSMPPVSPSTQQTSRTPGQATCNRAL